MALGTPVLLSNKDITSLPRIPSGSVGAEHYLECLLQEIVDRQPGVLPLADFCPRVTCTFSLGREIPVDIGGQQGFIDNLLVTDDGHLVVVETKLWRNPEAIREVVAQILQYGMAVSQLSHIEFENRLRRASPKTGRLGPNETVTQYLQGQVRAGQASALDADFEDTFDRFRRAGEIVLLIVADYARTSAERVVHWMNTTVGSAPYKLGLVELCLYELPGVGRIAIPKTLLRIREGSRHVVTINIENGHQAQVTATVSGPEAPTKTRPVALPAAPITEEALVKLIRENNSSDDFNTAQQLLEGLKSSDLDMNATKAWVKYGVRSEDGFAALVHLSGTEVYCYLPKRALDTLAPDEVIECKQQIHSVAEFYRDFDADDATASRTRVQHYDALAGKVDQFVKVLRDIADKIRAALQQSS